MKRGAMGPNKPNASIESELYICKKTVIILDNLFEENKGYEFKKGIVTDLKTNQKVDICFWYKTIYLDYGDFFNHFMTKAEWREKQIDSVLED